MFCFLYHYAKAFVVPETFGKSVFDSFVLEKVILPETSNCLHLSCWFGSEKSIKALFDEGANVEERNEVGNLICHMHVVK